MARLNLTLPEKILATIKIPVRINDINYGNHLGNHSLVSILHEARMQWLSGGGFSELDIKGSGLIMTELAVEYKAESFYGDVLSIAISVATFSSSVCSISTLIPTANSLGSTSLIVVLSPLPPAIASSFITPFLANS